MRLYHGSKKGLIGDILLDVYPGFHALSPEMAIEDLKGSVRQAALEPVQESGK